MSRRVAIFLPSLIGGGAERSALFVGKVLEEAGYTVDIVVAQAKGVLVDDPFAASHLVDLGALDPLLAYFRYARYLRAYAPDLVISFVHSANFTAGVVGQFRRDIPFIVSVRNTLLKEPRDQWWIRRWFGFGPERWLYRRAAMVQTVSRALAAQCRELFAIPRDKLWITYTSPQDFASAAPLATAPHEAHEIAGHQPYLVSAGRLVGIKGFATLIRAFSQARLAPEQRLLILGEGPMRSSLHQLIDSLGLQDRVALIGYRDSVLPWIEASDGFVFASRGEGLSRVVLEAMHMKVPIAAARAPGVTEVLGHGKFGRLVDGDDEAGFARAMEEIAAGTRRPSDMPQYESHMRSYSPETVAARYREMVERCIGPA